MGQPPTQPPTDHRHEELKQPEMKAQPEPLARGCRTRPSAQSYGESVSDNLEDYTFWQPVFIPEGLSREKLETLFRKFYLSFYLRPIIVWRHLTMLRRPSDVPRYARALALLFQRFIKTRVDAVFHTSEKA